MPRALHAPQLRSLAAEARVALAAAAPSDPHYGVRLRHANAATGGHLRPTIVALLCQLPETAAGTPRRSADAQMPGVPGGEGESEIGTGRIAGRAGDIPAVPNASGTRHRARRQAVILVFSNIARQQRRGLRRADTTTREDP